MSERTSPVVDAGDRVGWTATFITSKGFFYRGKLIGIIGSTYMMGTQMQAYPPTHYRIYDSPDNAPSKRVSGLCPSYDKVLDGTRAATAVGVAAMLRECPHFRAWVESLKQLCDR